MEMASLDRALNFGHCIGHAVEAASGFRFRHGEAVAIGMAVASRLGEYRGNVDTDFRGDLERWLEAYQLPTEIPETLITDSWKRIDDLRRVRNGSLRMATVRRPGDIHFVDDIGEAEFVNASRQASVRIQAI